MNMLDGLKVRFEKYDDANYYDGIVIQTQIIDERFLFAIMDDQGWVHTVRSQKVSLYRDSVMQIFNKPQEAVSRIRQAENADTIKHRTEILDIRP